MALARALVEPRSPAERDAQEVLALEREFDAINEAIGRLIIRRHDVRNALTLARCSLTREAAELLDRVRRSAAPDTRQEKGTR